jgi:hypothetical protein
MGQGDLKANPWVIVRAQRKTYVNAVTRRVKPSDILVLEIFPVVGGALLLLADVTLNTAAAAGMLTAAGIFSALLFGLMLQISERAMEWADKNPTPGPETSRHATFLTELAANAGYTSLTAIVLVGVLVAVAVSSGWTLRVFSAVALGLSIHLVLLIFLVMRRVFVLTEDRLRRARTGAGIDRSSSSTAA